MCDIDGNHLSPPPLSSAKTIMFGLWTPHSFNSSLTPINYLIRYASIVQVCWIGSRYDYSGWHLHWRKIDISDSVMIIIPHGEDVEIWRRLSKSGSENCIWREMDVVIVGPSWQVRGNEGGKVVTLGLRFRDWKESERRMFKRINESKRVRFGWKKKIDEVGEFSNI